jgi:two-component system sensor histidine kinase BaeS
VIRSLRRRLFAAILGAVLVAVGISLALGIVLTRGAVSDTIREDVSRQAEQLANQLRRGRTAPLPQPGRPGVQPVPRGGGARPFGPPRGEIPLPPPGGEPASIPLVVALARAENVLPTGAVADLRGGEQVQGTFTRNGEKEIYAAQRVRDSVVLVVRPDVVTSGDFARYLTALLISAGLAALLAAGAAALLSRRLTAPLERVAEASRVLAAGGSPEPVPREQTTELAALADAFNDMASQLQTAREAERAVLLSVSHELRTPLTSIKGYAEGIEDGTVPPAEAAPVIGREAGRLERLVADLLALARLRQGVLEARSEPVDLHGAAQEAVERLRPQARSADVQVCIEGPGSAKVTADHDRVVQVLSNLIENAVRLTPAGGTVTVSVAEGAASVRDQGPGIPAEDLPRAFDRFHLRRRHGGGSPDGAGTGLAIVRELTEAMGGSVSLRNSRDGGAEFTVRFRCET